MVFCITVQTWKRDRAALVHRTSKDVQLSSTRYPHGAYMACPTTARKEPHGKRLRLGMGSKLMVLLIQLLLAGSRRMERKSSSPDGGVMSWRQRLRSWISLPNKAGQFLRTSFRSLRHISRPLPIPLGLLTPSPTVSCYRSRGQPCVLILYVYGG